MTHSDQNIGRTAVLAAAILALFSLSGCGVQSSADGTADRTFSVSGPARLELANGSGDSQVIAGPAGEVRVHAQFRVRAWPWESAQRRASEVEANPPFSQEANLIRVGASGWDMHNLSVDYTITVPADAQLHSLSGSGNVQVNGIAGPVAFVVGSGNISAMDIAGDAHVTVGSGKVTLNGIQGQVEVTAGSGDVQIHGTKGEVHIRAGSGDIRIDQPGDDIVATTGSGDVDVTGASTDMRLHTASGDITVNGNPSASSYWDMHASSGDVNLHVPSDASFRFYARTSSGDIDVGIPAVMDGTAGKHEVRAKIGDAKARVEVQTSSGDISLH